MCYWPFTVYVKSISLIPQMFFLRAYSYCFLSPENVVDIEWSDSVCVISVRDTRCKRFQCFLLFVYFNKRAKLFLLQSIDVHWIPPPKRYCHGIITNYIIRYSPKDLSSSTKIIQVSSAVNQRTVSGLTKGKTYRFQLAAATSIGIGPFSSTQFLTVTSQNHTGMYVVGGLNTLLST